MIENIEDIKKCKNRNLLVEKTEELKASILLRSKDLKKYEFLLSNNKTLTPKQHRYRDELVYQNRVDNEFLSKVIFKISEIDEFTNKKEEKLPDLTAKLSSIRNYRLSLRDIYQTITCVTGINYEMIRPTSRRTDYKLVRFFATCLVRYNTSNDFKKNTPIKEVCNMLGFKNHSSVTHAVRTVDSWIWSNDECIEDLDKIIEYIKLNFTENRFGKYNKSNQDLYRECLLKEFCEYAKVDKSLINKFLYSS